MAFQDHTRPDALERYSFLWSEARLVVASIALFAGGVPPVSYVVLAVPALFGLVQLGLTLAWIISGLASGYLFYRWWKANRMLFGGKKGADTAAFLVSVISGLNLGVAGLTGANIGMRTFPAYGFLVVAGLAYLVSAYYLWTRWQSCGKKLF